MERKKTTECKGTPTPCTARTLALLAAVACALAAFSVDGGTPRPARLVKASGGLVEKPYVGKILRVADAQDTLPPGVVAAAAGDVRRLSRLPLVAEKSPATTSADIWRTVAALVEEAGTGAVLLVVADPALPFLVGSPDGRWAVVNVFALQGEAARATARLERLLWHAAALALGAGGAGEGGGVLAPFATLTSLDALPRVPGPAAHNALVDAARAHGVGFVILATYRQACQQGWAPAPTNDVQRAIWNQIHAIPDKPLTIEFDPKKGR